MTRLFILTMRDEDGTNYAMRYGWFGARYDSQMREHALVFNTESYAKKRAAMLDAQLTEHGPHDWIRGPVKVWELHK